MVHGLDSSNAYTHIPQGSFPCTEVVSTGKTALEHMAIFTTNITHQNALKRETMWIISVTARWTDIPDVQ